MNEQNLKDKRIWVIGGAGYLGRPCVKLLADMGANVSCLDLGEYSQQSIEQEGLTGRVQAVSFDLGNVESSVAWARNEIREHGAPYGIVQLAMATTASRLGETTESELDHIFHVNLTAQILLLREVGSAMAEAGEGSIVLFSSMYGKVAPDVHMYEPLGLTANPLPYGMAKAAIAQMGRYFAVEWGHKNVRCNCISPGPAPNTGVQASHPEFVEELVKRSPMRRVGRQDEMAGTVAHLLSPASSYINGQDIGIDGGWTAW